jgi:uncharacterized protein (TIGR02145 family)
VAGEIIPSLLEDLYEQLDIFKMKHILIFLTILAFGFTQAQPQKVNYQAVALAANGQPVKNQAIMLRLSIVDSSATGTVLYTETHQPTTDGAGQFSVFLGGGTANLGSFSNIFWGNGKDKFLKAEADVTGGTNYVLMGASQIVSVPYAIAAGSLMEGATITGTNGSQYTLTVGANGPTWNLTNPNVNFSCGQALTYAGESYPTVQIGSQCWFQKNVNAGTMVQGSLDQTNNGILEKYCYNNLPANCDTFGGLYQWAEAVQYQNGASNNAILPTSITGNVRGICPNDWHVPSDSDFCILTSFLDLSANCNQFGTTSSNSGGGLKSLSNLWVSPNIGATNNSGFTALPGGSGDFPNFHSKGYGAYFFTSNNFNSLNCVNFMVSRHNTALIRTYSGKIYGNSIRCLKD